MKWLILEFGLISSIIITLYPYDRSVANVVSEWREGGKGDDWSEGETTESTKVVWFLVYLVNDSLVCVSLIPSTSLGSVSVYRALPCRTMRCSPTRWKRKLQPEDLGKQETNNRPNNPAFFTSFIITIPLLKSPRHGIRRELHQKKEC